MTKREHKALQELVNKHSEYREKADRAFERLQDLNEKEGSGSRWCCAATNMEDLLAAGKDYVYLYTEYVENNAKADTLEWELGRTLAGLNFWK